MTYKEKKLKEFENNHKSTWDIQEKGIVATVIDFDEAKDFLSSTIDEIMACLPEERKCKIDVSPTPDIYNFNACREEFFLNLDQKAGGV